MKKIFCFGEPLLRMSPTLGTWINDASMQVYLGGSELNVAVALARWKRQAKFGGALPENYLGKEIETHLTQTGIDVSAMQHAAGRIGTYYLPLGHDLQNEAVIYDREDSSFANLSPGMINWEEVLADCDWFHFSAISPALNKNASAICQEALFYAARKRMTISVDLNYRAGLWQFDKKPIQVMPDLASYCQVIMGNLWSAGILLGIPMDEDIHEKNSKTAYLDHANKTSRALLEKFPACQSVANTFRFNQGKGLLYYATLDEAAAQHVSPEFHTGSVVDRVGSGDCFMAGLIYGISGGNSSQEVINYAAAAAFGKLQELGDSTHQTVEGVQQLLKNYE